MDKFDERMIAFLILGVLIGISLTAIYFIYIDNNSTINTKNSLEARVYGIWTANLSNLNRYDGRFICINIDETKTIDDLVSTCEHEAGHEVWARICEKNFTKCQEAVK